MKKTIGRIARISDEIAAITEFAEGTVSCSSSRYRLKDGTWKKAKPHWKFQSLGPRGKRRYVHVPAACVERVNQSVENGRRYRALEAEYSQLVTEASLEGTGEKNSIALPRPRYRRVEEVVGELRTGNTGSAGPSSNGTAPGRPWPACGGCMPRSWQHRKRRPPHWSTWTRGGNT